MDRQRWLWAILGVTLLLVWWLRDGSGGDPGAALPGSGRQVGPVVRQRPLPDDIVGLQLARLEPRSAEYSVGRDPFRFGVVPTPLPTPTPERRATPPPPLPTPTPEPTPFLPIPPSMDHLRYLGSFGPQKRQIAVLKAGEDEIYIRREGEVVEEVFVVVHIGLVSVDVGWVDFPDETPQRLGVGG